MLALDPGEPLFVSTPTYQATGAVTREWQQIPFTDGVGVVQFPEGSDPSAIRVVAGPRPTSRDIDPQRYRSLQHTNQYLGHLTEILQERTLPWWRTGIGVARIGASRDEPDSQVSDEFDRALNDAGVVDPVPGASSVTRWNVLAGLDGGTAIVGEHQDNNAPSRLFAVLRDASGRVTQVLFCGEVDQAAVLPVRMHLPGGRGWIVAAYTSALRYRTTPDGPWLIADTGRDAALLPEAATEVEVTPEGGAPVVVPLPQ